MAWAHKMLRGLTPYTSERGKLAGTPGKYWQRMKGERASDLRRAHERWAWHTTNRAPHEELPRPLPLPIPFPSLTPSLSNLHHPRSTGGAIKEITLGGGVDANDDGGSGSRCMNFNTIIATKSSHPPFDRKRTACRRRRIPFVWRGAKSGMFIC